MLFYELIAQKIKMIDVIKEPHTAMFTGPTNCGKTKRVLDLIEGEYNGCFENIIIICPTLRWNKTYLERPWIWKDDYVFCIEPRDKLFNWIEQLSKLLATEETLFIIDDCIADETLDKKRQPLLELAVSGRHRNHSLWLLTQSYTALPKNLRRQKKQLFMWYPNERSDFELVDRETNVIPQNELDTIKNTLQKSKHGCLYIRLEYPRKFEVLP